MENYTKSIAKMKKACKLVRLSQHKNGPRSYKRGQGALLRVLLGNDGAATQRDLVATLGMNRKMLKDIVRKAQRNEYVTIQEAEGKKTYIVALTDEGRAVAEKREKAQEKASEAILSVLTAEELAQFDAINEKLIVACKEAGVDGKRKGRKAHRKAHCKAHGHGHCHCHHGHHHKKH